MSPSVHTVQPDGSRHSRVRILPGVATTAAALLLVALLPTPAFAASTAAPTDLGRSAVFSVLAAAAATIPGSNLPGQVGAGSAITDDATTKYGSVRHAVNDQATRDALADATAAYTRLSSLPATGTLTGDDLAAQTIRPGVYHRVAAYAMTTPATFDAQGNPNANFIMQGDAALNTTASTTMRLINGAQASHIFWVLRGAATLGASSHFYGTILSGAAITVGATSIVDGRALSVAAAVTLDADNFGPVTVADTTPPVIAFTGGPTASTTLSKPTIAGSTDAPAGSIVTVKVAGQTLTSVVSRTGKWSVVAAALPNGAASIVATVSDAAGNVGRALETLNVAIALAPHTVAVTVYFAAGSAVLSPDTSARIAAIARRIPANASNIAVKVAGFVRHMPMDVPSPVLAAARASNVTQSLSALVRGTYTVTSDGSGLSWDVTAQCAVITITYSSPIG